MSLVLLSLTRVTDPSLSRSFSRRIQNRDYGASPCGGVHGRHSGWRSVGGQHWGWRQVHAPLEEWPLTAQRQLMSLPVSGSVHWLVRSLNDVEKICSLDVFEEHSNHKKRQKKSVWCCHCQIPIMPRACECDTKSDISTSCFLCR